MKIIDKVEKLIPYFLTVLFLVWVFINRDIYLDPTVYLSRDNAHSLLPSFANIVNQVKVFQRFPDWFFSKEGGVWVPTLSNLLLSIAPHRILGYVLGAFTHWNTNAIYKISFLVIGKGIYLIGCYLLLKRLLNSSAVWAGTILILGFLTSNGLSFFHQESSFAVLFFLPWIWYFYLRLADAPHWFPAFCALLGYSFNLYYPQLFVCYWFAVLLGVALFWKHLRENILQRVRLLRACPLIVLAGVTFFTLTSLPLTYSYVKYSDRFTSPLREREGNLSAKTFRELVSMQSTRCNVHPANIGSYFGISKVVPQSMDPQDQRSLYVGPIGLLALVLLLVTQVPLRGFQIFLLIALAGLAIGFYGFVPRLIWWWLPGMKMFRQYYHFLEIFNAHLIVLFAFVLKSAAGNKRISKFMRQAAVAVVVLWVLTLNFKWSLRTLDAYRGDFKESLAAEGVLAPKPFEGKEFAEELLLKQEYPYEAGVKTTKPRGVQHLEYQKLWEKVGGVHLKTGRVFIPFRNDDLQVDLKNGAFEIHILRAPGNPNSLEILQFNDGNWSAKSADNNRVPIAIGKVGNISIPNIYSGSKISIRRNESIWHWIVITAFFTLILAFVVTGTALFCKNRTLVTWRWLPAPTFSIKTQSQ